MQSNNENGNRFSYEETGIYQYVKSSLPRATLQFENKSSCGYDIRVQGTEGRSRLTSSATSYLEDRGLKFLSEYKKSSPRFSWVLFSPSSQAPTIYSIRTWSIAFVSTPIVLPLTIQLFDALSCEILEAPLNKQ
jgi:hypothetical protein